MITALVNSAYTVFFSLFGTVERFVLYHYPANPFLKSPSIYISPCLSPILYVRDICGMSHGIPL